MAGDVVAPIEHAPGARHVERAENVEQGRLPAARRAEKHHELSLVERHVHAPQGVHLDVAHLVHLAHILGGENGGAFAAWAGLWHHVVQLACSFVRFVPMQVNSSLNGSVPGGYDPYSRHGSATYCSCSPNPNFENVTRGGQTWRYADTGQGPVVVLIHGFPDTPQSYDGIARALNDAGYRTIVPYLRGYHPDTMMPGRPYDALHLAEDAIGLLDALDLQSAVFVGHDWGATLVWGAAALAPDRVDGIVPIAIPHPRTLKPKNALQALGLLVMARHFLYFRLPWAEAGTRRGDFRIHRFAVSALGAGLERPRTGRRAGACEGGLLDARGARGLDRLLPRARFEDRPAPARANHVPWSAGRGRQRLRRSSRAVQEVARPSSEAAPSSS